MSETSPLVTKFIYSEVFWKKNRLQPTITERKSPTYRHANRQQTYGNIRKRWKRTIYLVYTFKLHC